MRRHLFTSLLLSSLFCLVDQIAAAKPNIVVLIADDLGWDDVGFHGSPHAHTPHLDKLATEGVILNSYYVNPICTPTRSALLTGKYPVNNGMQSSVIMTHQPWGLGLNNKLLPEFLQELGYQTYLIGKWHLGFFAREYTPSRRGFDRFYGCYAGRGDYYTHESQSGSMMGLDLRDGEAVVRTENGTYSTQLFTDEATKVIAKHDQRKPMFLVVSYQAVHSANPKQPLQAPHEMISLYKGMSMDSRRKTYLGMTSAMDAGIGKIHRALLKHGMMNNTVLFFTTDNGGAADGFDDNQASNYPLRGMKTTLFEGGVRATGFVYSPLLHSPQRISHDLMHIVDWFPTILKLAGGTLRNLHDIDGRDMWKVLSVGAKSPREELLLNIDDFVYQNFALRYKNWKIIYEGNGYALINWYHPYHYTRAQYERLPRLLKFEAARLNCSGWKSKPESCLNVCIFDIEKDPCEMNDISEENPALLEVLLKKVHYYRDRMALPMNNHTLDNNADPKRHGGVWEPWVTLVGHQSRSLLGERMRPLDDFDVYQMYHQQGQSPMLGAPKIDKDNEIVSKRKKNILRKFRSLFMSSPI